VRIRARFTKLGRVRWTSHRDVARMWERALRRGRVPVAYTEGFTPRPQLSFGLALPTGCESVAEYPDIALDSALEPADLAREVGSMLPDGVDVVAAVAQATDRLVICRGIGHWLTTGCGCSSPRPVTARNLK